MPLHDWSRTPDWFTVHQIWAGEIAGMLNRRLPRGFRAKLGPVPGTGSVGLGVPDVRTEGEDTPDEVDGGPFAATFHPDFEGTVAEADTETAAFVFDRGRLVTAIELISPGNKDRPERREQTAARYFNYVQAGANLVIVDVHPQPARATVPDRLGAQFGLNPPPLPAPYVICYRVRGERLPGRRVAGWSRPLAVGRDLPEIPVPLVDDLAVRLDLAETYAAAVEKGGLE